MTLRTRWLPILAVLFLLMSLTVREAIAHAHLERSSPSAKEQLATTPRIIQLWFSETPQVPFTRIQLIGPGGAEVPVGPVTAGAQMSVSVAVESNLAPGEYTVAWQTGAADGHPTRGRFAFTLKASAAPLATDTAAMATDTNRVPVAPRGNSIVGSPTDTSAVAPREQGATRWPEFMALLTIIGVVTFRFVIVPGLARQGAPTADLLDSALRLGRASVVLLLVAIWARLYLEMRMMLGARAAAPGMLRETVLSTTWGHGWLVGVIGALVAGAGFLLAKRMSAGWGIAAVGTLLAAIAPALTGHAIASATWRAPAVVADVLHVIGGGVWLGTLATIVLALLPSLRAREPIGERASLGAALLTIVRAFNPVALIGAATLVASGVVSAWLRLGSISALFGSFYGKLLLLKIALVVIVVAAGAWNWRRMTPTLGDERSALRLRRSAILELTVAALVLLATATLVVTPLPTETTAMGASRTSSTR